MMKTVSYRRHSQKKTCSAPTRLDLAGRSVEEERVGPPPIRQDMTAFVYPSPPQLDSTTTPAMQCTVST